MIYACRAIIVLLFTFYFLLFTFTLPSSAAESPLQRRDHITIAVKDNLPPLGFRDAKGNLQGYEIDLAKALVRDLVGKENAAKLQPVLNRDRLSMVIDGKVDLAIARVTATESRSRLVNFSIPYYLDGTLVISKDSSIETLNNLINKRIAVLRNSSTIARVKYFIPKAQLVGVSAYEEARSLLQSNKIDAFAADASVLSGWVQQFPEYRLLIVPLSTEPLCVVIPKGLQYDEMRRKINNAIAGYIASGWLKERADYWGLKL
jgi:polar amino acid transport system substrate-binding protein